jgi:hypothetical protein
MDPPAKSTDGKFGVEWEPELLSAFLKSQIVLITWHLEKLRDRFRKLDSSERDAHELVMYWEMLRNLEPLVGKAGTDKGLKRAYDEARKLLDEILNPWSGKEEQARDEQKRNSERENNSEREQKEEQAGSAYEKGDDKYIVKVRLTDAQARETFTKIDTNRDDYLSTAEYFKALRRHADVAEILGLPVPRGQESAARTVVQRTFAAIDTNDDKKLSRAEFGAFYCG